MNNKYNDENYLKYLKDIRKYKILSIDEELELKGRILSGDESAKDELYKSHLRFVVSIAKTYTNSFLTLPDLINEGNYGMMVAISRFDYSSENRFMTYASHWIRHYIHASLNKVSRTVRVPINLLTNSDLKLELNNNTSEFNDQLDGIGDSNVEETNVFLPELIQEEGGLEITDLIDCLNDRESQIIKMYFGIECERPYNLGEIGEIIGLTKERVRQVKLIALKKMKSNINNFINN